LLSSIPGRSSNLSPRHCVECPTKQGLLRAGHRALWYVELQL
jgi:hypothetical protein